MGQTELADKKRRGNEKRAKRTWHQKNTSRRREWEIENRVSDYYTLRFLLTWFQHHVCHCACIPTPSFLPNLYLILIPEAFCWQTLINNIRQPQLTSDTKRINASDQSEYSYNLLSALEADERVQYIVTHSPALPVSPEKLMWSTQIYPALSKCHWVIA